MRDENTSVDGTEMSSAATSSKIADDNVSWFSCNTGGESESTAHQSLGPTPAEVAAPPIDDNVSGMGQDADHLHIAHVMCLGYTAHVMQAAEVIGARNQEGGMVLRNMLF